MSATSRRNKEAKERARERGTPAVAPVATPAPAKQPDPPRFSSWTPGPDDREDLRFWASPRTGDIVETRFPDFLRDQFGIKSVVKTRPCLVVGVEEFANGQTVVKVAYGTSHTEDRRVQGQNVEGIQPGEMVVLADDKRTGLTSDTKFSLRKVLDLPFSTEFFSPCPSQRFGVYPKRGKVDLNDPAYRRSIDGAIREAREHGSLLEVDEQGVRLKKDVMSGRMKR